MFIEQLYFTYDDSIGSAVDVFDTIQAAQVYSNKADFSLHQQQIEIIKVVTLHQKIQVGRNLKTRFDEIIRSLELESTKWKETFDSIKNQIDSNKPQDEYMLTVIRFTEVIDTSTDLVQSSDIQEILNLSPYSYRSLVTLRYNEDAVHVMVDLLETSCCIIL